MALQPNALYFGDNLDWMAQWDDESVDLVYLDPPFNSNTNYNILYSTAGGGQAQVRAFDDTWHWDTAAAERYAMYERAAARPAHRVITGLYQVLGKSGMLAYLTYMAERLEHCHRLLKPTGSIYLHCDPTMSHYLKLVMDAIFGAQHFRNEVIWHYKSFHGNVKRYFARKHDTLFMYSKSSNWSFNRQWGSDNTNTIDVQRWRDYLIDGRYILARNMPIQDTRFTRYLRRWQRENGRDPMPDEVVYEVRGQALDSVWGIKPVDPKDKQRLGYPTQKPLALLERIIAASSNPDDIVLDPFCGCGTTIDAARRLDRQFVGIDISSFAIDLIIEQRLRDGSIPVYGIPSDLASARRLAQDKPFRFESWAVERLPGFQPNIKQVADSGIDGWGSLFYQPEDYSRQALAQVKGGTFKLSELRDFLHVTGPGSRGVGLLRDLRASPDTGRAAGSGERRDRDGRRAAVSPDATVASE